jgi:twitching motility protein PilT
MASKEKKSLLVRLIKTAKEENASDLHLREESIPRVRVDGELYDLEHPPLTQEEMQGLLQELCDANQLKQLVENRGIDLSYEIPDVCRLRVNLYISMGYTTAAIRLIPTVIPTMEEIYLPQACYDFCQLRTGLVLVTGPTGSGKSTTLAAMIDHINYERRSHIITSEDPVEFLYEEQLATITQREIGRDALSFADALRHSFRQDPDVVMIGEMRDLETMQIAITLAETGHLTFSTLHTNEAAGTINRIIDSFPPHQQAQIRSQLSVSLAGIISQLLLPRIDRTGRVAAREVLVCTRAVKNMIRENKISQLASAMQTGSEEGMIPMNASLGELLREGLISYEVALMHSNDRKEFRTKYSSMSQQAKAIG